jgi:hypothetical protein
VSVAVKRNAAANPVEVGLFCTAAVMPAAQSFCQAVVKPRCCLSREYIPVATDDPMPTRSFWPTSYDLQPSMGMLFQFQSLRKASAQASATGQCHKAPQRPGPEPVPEPVPASPASRPVADLLH